MLHALIADAQARLDDARRQLRLAAINFDVPDDELLELRAKARTVYNELANLDRKKLKGSRSTRCSALSTKRAGDPLRVLPSGPCGTA